MAELKKVLKNDIVYYLHTNNSNSSVKEITNACMIEYNESRIVEAKAYLLEECSSMLKDINNELVTDVSTVRNNSCNRSKQEAIIDDIIKMINCLEGTECDIEFTAVNPSSINKSIPEAFNVNAILDRLEAAHNDIKSLKDINAKLNEDITDLRSEINTLKLRYVSPQTPHSTRSLLNRPRCPPPPIPHKLPTSSPSSFPRQPVPSAPPPSSPQQPAPTAPPALLVGITHASDDENEDDSDEINNADDGNKTSNPNGSNRIKVKLTAKQKHERNIIYMNSALAATAAATSSGENPQTAIEIGRQTGAKTATSWADRARSNNALAANYGVNFPALANNRGRNSSSNVNKNVNKNAKKSKLALVSPFASGNAIPSTQGISVVSQKPSYMDNKCLVIRGLDKEISRSEFQRYINTIAGRPINILRDEPISKEYSRWLTIALEISVQDFDTLNNPSIWSSDLAIREFVGWRWWRSTKPKRLTTNDIRNSMRDQWKC